MGSSRQIEVEFAKSLSHVAVVVDNALLRMQARRMGHPEKMRLFDTVEDANAWLATKSPR